VRGVAAVQIAILTDRLAAEFLKRWKAERYFEEALDDFMLRMEGEG
jgi:hypothetical protein